MVFLRNCAIKSESQVWEIARNYLTQDKITSFLREQDLWEMAHRAAQKILPGAWQLLAGTANLLLGLIGLFVIILYLIFLLIDYEKFRYSWRNMLPRRHRETVVNFIQDFNRYMNRYFRSQALVASLVGILFATGFSLIGLPMAIVLGLFIGLLNMVPYLQLLGIIPTLLVIILHCLETGANFWHVLAATGGVFAVVQAAQDGFFIPKIMGKSMGLNPAMILLSLSIWGKLLGILGLLIALPMTCLLLAYYNEFIAGPVPPSEESAS
ncbi:MAG: AI-2E family transporter [Desulfonatronovibrionaceae bacterium]